MMSYANHAESLRYTLRFAARIFLLLILCWAIPLSPAFGDDVVRDFINKKSKQLEDQAVALAGAAVKTYLEKGKHFVPPSGLDPMLGRSAGVFVTIIKNGKVRSCMGTIEPKEDSIAQEIVRSAIMAATQDHWHPPITHDEVNALRYVISIVGRPRKIASINKYNPATMGILVRRGNRSALLLPGEALTRDWALFRCKEKAGIPQNEKVELYTFPTATLGP